MVASSRVKSYKLRAAFFPYCFVSIFINSFEMAVNELNVLSRFHSLNYGRRGNTSGNTNVEHHKKLD